MANPIDIVISKEALAEIDKAISKVGALDKEIQSTAQSFITNSKKMASAIGSITPNDVSQSISENSKLNAELDRMNKTIKEQGEQLERLRQIRNNNIKILAEERTERRLLNKIANEEAMLNSKLAGAYAKLNIEHQRAARYLQDLIARGKLATQTQRDYDKEIKIAQKEFTVLNDRILIADKAVGRFNRNVGNYPMQAARGIKELAQAFGFVGGVTGVVMLGKNIFETTKELMSLDGAMKLVTKTTENFANQQVFLQRISEAYGVEISALQKQFTQFYVSASDKISGTAIQNIFESVAKSSAKMGLSVESQDRAFLALNQMMSKGTVTAEELRGQLGEALPGAFGIMARAMGVTEKQLGKMMKDGKVIASEVLPLFAKELEKTYGVENVKRVDNLAAAQTRFSNAWKNFVRSLDSDGNKLSKFFSSILNITTDLVKGVEVIFESSETKRLNVLKGLRDKGYSETLEYYKNNKEATENDMILHKQYNANKIVEFNKEKKQIVERAKLFSQKFGERSFSKTIGGENQEDRVKAEANLKKDMERLKAISQVSQKYAGEISAINQLLAKRPASSKENEELTKEQQKSLEERLKNQYEYNKAQLNLQLAKIDSLVNNEDLYYTDRLTALDADLIKRTEIANLDYKEELRLAKDSSEKKKTALINFQIEQLKLIEDYNKKKNNLEKLDLDPITTLNKSKSADGIKDVADSAKTATKELENTAEAVEKTRKQLEDLKKTTEDWLGSFSTEFLQNSGLGSLETFFDGTFDKLLEGAQTTEEKFAVTFNAIAESAQEMFNFISNASQANFDAEYARLESQKDVALKFAGDSATSKKKIEEDYEKKKKEIANRENKAKQKQAIFNIAIDTAQAIVGLWAKPGFPMAIPLAIAVGALGAAQIGMVAAQKIPQYFDGGVHGGGLAMINDAGGSNYVETVVTPDGKVQQFKGRDVVTDLPKGTEIFTPEQWQQKELEYMLNSRGVMLNNQASKGFTAEQMDAILAKHFGKIQTNTTVFDKKGIMQFSEMNGNKTIRNANRATGLGFKV